MARNSKRFWHSRWVAIPMVTALALWFFLVGLVLPVDWRWSGATAAESPSLAESEAAPAKPESFAALARQLSPTVVNIKVVKLARVRDGGRLQVPQGPFGEFFRRFFEDAPRSRRQFQQEGAGSGVIIREEGYILTNNHVVDGAQEMTVTLADGKTYGATLVGQDRKTDLAVVKIEPTASLPVAAMGDSEALQVGDWVLAIGNPFGLGHTVTSGIVSAKGRVIGAGPYDDFIQTDASINPGNSGGPLFDMRGQVVGINTAILPYGRGIGFAIPINTARPLIPQLVSTGTVTRGYLGVGIQSLTPELAAALQLEEPKGALVAEVTPGSPAERAGIRQGDVIVAYNRNAVDKARDLPVMVASTPVGETRTVVVWRDGTTREFPLTVGRFPVEAETVARPEPPRRGKWGLDLRQITPEMARQHGLQTDHGVLVAGVESDTPAARAGVRPGDILLEVNHQPVSSIEAVRDVLDSDQGGDSLLLLVQRRQGNLYVALAK